MASPGTEIDKAYLPWKKTKAAKAEPKVIMDDNLRCWIISEEGGYREITLADYMSIKSYNRLEGIESSIDRFMDR